MRKLKVDELQRINVSEYKNCIKLPVIVILDNVRSLYNVGSIFRTSDAFRVEKIILCGITATPDNSLVEIHKTALGAEESVDWTYSKDCISVVKELNEKGYVTVAVEQVEDSIKLDNLVVDNTMRYALVFGNEVKGVNQEVVDMCKNNKKKSIISRYQKWLI